MQLPREVLIGKDVAPHVGATLKRLGYSGTALIVTGPRVRSIAAELVIQSLDQAGFKSSIIITESSTTDEVLNVQREIKLRSADIVVGVGGGKDIDVAKLSSMKEQKTFLSVPTAASHDGIASPLVSMKGMNRPYSYVAHSPVAIVADTSIIAVIFTFYSVCKFPISDSCVFSQHVAAAACYQSVRRLSDYRGVCDYGNW